MTVSNVNVWPLGNEGARWDDMEAAEQTAWSISRRMYTRYHVTYITYVTPDAYAAYVSFVSALHTFHTLLAHATTWSISRRIRATWTSR